MPDAIIDAITREWPSSWKGVEADVLVGKAIVKELLPFIHYLYRCGYSTRTTKNHLDNLWVLGGEIIRRKQPNSKEANPSTKDLILRHIDEYGGPVLHHSYSENEQESCDVTCRKLHKFMKRKA